MRPTLYIPFYIKATCIVIGLIAFGYIAIIGGRILIPLCFSFLFAILLLPLSNFLENICNLPRGISAILSSMLFIFSIILIIYLLGSQLASFSKDWPLLKTQLADLMVNSQAWISKTFHIDAKKETDFLNTTSDKLLQINSSFLGKTILSIS